MLCLSLMPLTDDLAGYPAWMVRLSTLWLRVFSTSPDIFVDYSPASDVGTMTLVVFELPDQHAQNRFILTSISPTKWGYEGLIQL